MNALKRGRCRMTEDVMTTDTDEQAEERMIIKGEEAAQVAIEMANLLKALA